MEPSEFAEFQKSAASKSVETVRTANELAAADLPFQRTLNPALGDAVDRQSDRLRAFANRLLQKAAEGSKYQAPKLKDVEDVDYRWRDTVDIIDDCLERTDSILDEFTGVIKRLSPSRQGAATQGSGKASREKIPSMYGDNAQITKPQLRFNKPVANSTDAVFKPLLRSKPHAAVPFEESLGVADDGSLKQYKHPYEVEIKQTAFPPPARAKSEPIKYLPFDSTSAIEVNTMEGVRAMLEELKNATEIAIDLEHHDMRSYVGLTSLMQISTREKDWIVDTLEPWREELQVLNEVFANPSILKVFHGSFMDMIWLQRDFGLYVVNLFDTFWACQALQFPRASLAWLLEKYTGFVANKSKFQTADWRVRPLPASMKDYARSDTHYLLYIYDNLRNELIDASTPQDDLLTYVQEKSKEYSLQKYETTPYDIAGGSGTGGWLKMVKSYPGNLTNEQFAVLRALHAWRDNRARLQDESPHYIMSSQSLIRVAEEVPTDVAGLKRAATPTTKTVNSFATNLLAVIQEAKAQAEQGPSLIEVLDQAKKARGDAAKSHPPPTKLPPQASSSRLAAAEGRCVYVGNVPFSMTERQLQAFFLERGFASTGLKIPAKGASGRPAGYGFVDFTTIELAKDAIAKLNGEEIGGRTLSLWLAPYVEDSEKEADAKRTKSAASDKTEELRRLASTNSETQGFKSTFGAALTGESLMHPTSQFWGSVFPTTTEQLRQPLSVGTVSISLPILTSNVFIDAEDGGLSAQKASQSPPPPAVPEPAPESTNEPFILRQIGGSRKRKSEQADLTPKTPSQTDVFAPASNVEGDESDGLANAVPLTYTDSVDEDRDLDSTSPSSKTSRRNKKHRSRAEKRAQKAAAAADASQQHEQQRPTTANGPENGYHAVPFDYENAGSVLHAKPEGGFGGGGKGGKDGKGKEKGKGKKAFNPYAKAADAPKGLGRARREIPGKSATFGK